MADIGVSPSASYTVGADVIGTVGYQRVKVQVGTTGTATDVDVNNPFPVQVSGYTTSAVVSGAVTVATQLGTQVVSVVPGVSVNVGGLATAGYTTTGAAVGTGVVVWLGASQTVHIDFDPYETTAQPAVGASAMIVRQVDFYATTATPAVAASGQVVWVANPQPGVTTAAPAANATAEIVRQIDFAITTAPPGAGATGQIVYIANATAASVSVSVNATMAYKTPVVIQIAANAAVAPNTKVAFTISAGGAPVAGTTSWAVPAGKTFEIVGGAVYAKTSAVISFAQLAISAETATASASVTSTMNIAFVLPYGITAATAGFSVVGVQQDVAAATSIALLVIGGTTHSHVGGAIYGYLF